MLKLALGPILTYWPRETVFSFYADIAQSAVETVYLGELVCSRRHELRASDWLELAAMLADHGKEVVLSTMALIEANTDVTAMRRITDNGRFLVEANDFGAVGCVGGRPFVAGPHLNVYNRETLNLMAERGARRWVPPLEMKRAALAEMMAGKPAGLETELFAFGRMPLAFSARCFTARNRNLPKDDCGFTCIQYPDGLLLQTREHQPFLVLNGTQTQSAGVHVLLRELPDIAALGVDALRLSPQSQHMPQVISLYDAVRRGTLAADEAMARLAPLLPGAPCNGFWHGEPGMNLVEAVA